MATYVLVHGGGHGGWCYQRVARILQAKGHDVYAPTMTGLGERAHLLNAEVDLHRHIEDIAAVLQFEDLRDVILVGHSYGGMVITGTADRVADRIGRLVFLDAANPVNGQSLADVAGPVINAVRPFGETIDGMELVLLPAPDAGLLYGVTDPDDLAWMAERLTAHPWKCFEQPLELTNEAALWAIPQYHIVCTSTLATRDADLMATARAEGRLWDIDTGTRPDDHRAGEGGGRITPGRRRLTYTARSKRVCLGTRRGSGGSVWGGKDRTMGKASGSIRGRLGLAALALTAGIGVTSLADGTAGAATSSGSPITLVMITSLTGEGSSEFSNAPAGFNARIALQNAEGGIDGHKINGVVLDDQTSPTEIATAVQDALSKNPVGIVSTSPLFFLADKYPQQAGMPVTGGFFDGPEWGDARVHEHVRRRRGQRRHQVPGQHGHRRLHEGARRHGRLLLRVRDLAVVQPVRRRHEPLVRACRREVGCARHLHSVRLGGHDHTGARRQAGRLQRLLRGPRRQLERRVGHRAAAGGRQAEGDGLPDGLRPQVIGTPAWKAVQGGYFETEFRPFSLPNAGTEQMQKALEKYAHFSSTDFPSFSPVRVLARGGSHDQGPSAGRPDCIARRRHQGAARDLELQRQRAAP